nr:putative thioredoxin [uncultured Gammaproteobacteria bacterium]
MKSVLYLIVSVLLLACADQQGAQPPSRLEELRGHWVVINYWAQWCKPCIEEIPELNALDRTYDQVTVLGVNFDGATGQELAQQQQQLGVAFATLEADPSEDLGIPRPVVLPTTLIVSPDGELTQTLVGPQTLESLALATRQTTGGNTE